MKLIKLTNAVVVHKGNPIYINPDHITVVYDAPDAEGGSLKTFIFGGFTGVSWEVEESPTEIIRIIEQTDEKKFN